MVDAAASKHDKVALIRKTHSKQIRAGAAREVQIGLTKSVPADSRACSALRTQTGHAADRGHRHQERRNRDIVIRRIAIPSPSQIVIRPEASTLQ
jgi:hypothetical protein